MTPSYFRRLAVKLCAARSSNSVSLYSLFTKTLMFSNSIYLIYFSACICNMNCYLSKLKAVLPPKYGPPVPHSASFPATFPYYPVAPLTFLIRKTLSIHPHAAFNWLNTTAITMQISRITRKRLSQRRAILCSEQNMSSSCLTLI